jgi:undecaprenyl phosphate-alpha-L-ara4N flippase subunit ArnE
MSSAYLGVALVIFGTVLEGLGQVFLKKSALHPAARVLWLGLGISLVAAEALLYMMALRFLPVSVAFAIGGLSFVTVAIFARLILHEHIAPPRWVGVLLILGGASLIVANV